MALHARAGRPVGGARTCRQSCLGDRVLPGGGVLRAHHRCSRRPRRTRPRTENRALSTERCMGTNAPPLLARHSNSCGDRVDAEDLASIPAPVGTLWTPVRPGRAARGQRRELPEWPRRLCGRPCGQSVVDARFARDAGGAAFLSRVRRIVAGAARRTFSGRRHRRLCGRLQQRTDRPLGLTESGRPARRWLRPRVGHRAATGCRRALRRSEARGQGRQSARALATLWPCCNGGRRA